MLTTCPECKTTFRIGQAHLDARRGLVRCGHCGDVFNAYDSLLPEIETPPPEASHAPEPRIWPDETAPIHEVERTDAGHWQPEPVAADAGWQAAPEPWPEPAAPAEPAWEAREYEAVAAATDPDAEPPLPDAAAVAGPETEPATEAAETESSEDILLSELPTAGKAAGRAAWKGLAYVILALLLVVLFLGQLVYFLRGEIVSHQPQWRPWLESACEPIGCRVPLARDLDKVRIEWSALETDPEQPAHARLRISLVNRSNAEQAWPHLLLKLTNAKNAPLAQRAFAPADYRPKAGDPAYGLRPMSEHEFVLDLDLAAVAAAGYEVRLHYP